jgi:hypothetical protein
MAMPERLPFTFASCYAVRSAGVGEAPRECPRVGHSRPMADTPPRPLHLIECTRRRDIRLRLPLAYDDARVRVACPRGAPGHGTPLENYASGFCPQNSRFFALIELTSVLV